MFVWIAVVSGLFRSITDPSQISVSGWIRQSKVFGIEMETVFRTLISSLSSIASVSCCSSGSNPSSCTMEMLRCLRNRRWWVQNQRAVIVDMCVMSNMRSENVALERFLNVFFRRWGDSGGRTWHVSPNRPMKNCSGRFWRDRPSKLL